MIDPLTPYAWHTVKPSASGNCLIFPVSCKQTDSKEHFKTECLLHFSRITFITNSKRHMEFRSACQWTWLHVDWKLTEDDILNSRTFESMHLYCHEGSHHGILWWMEAPASPELSVLEKCACSLYCSISSTHQSDELFSTPFLRCLHFQRTFCRLISISRYKMAPSSAA